MAADPSRPAAPPRPADNSLSWPSLAALLAPAAGCDCQMLALTLAGGLASSEKAAPPPPARR